MSILCALFGHQPLTDAGWSGRPGYAKVMGDTIDGMGTRHLFLRARCPRCGQEYDICKVHVPEPRK